MNSLVTAFASHDVETTNGMKALSGTGSRALDLFFKIGASRGKNIVPEFIAAYAENADTALRIVAWARDIRGGAGERQIFKDVLSYLESVSTGDAIRLVKLVPEIGRWDDLLLPYKNDAVRVFAWDLIKSALDSGNALCAKWMPRKGYTAELLREYFGWTPKYYRKRLVELTKVVETQMCARDWDNINYSAVPSVAAARYRRAFDRHSANYAKYINDLKSGVEGVKINASAIFPHDVVAPLRRFLFQMSIAERDAVVAQWNALPNYVNGARALPVIDVSGSMTVSYNNSGVVPLDVAVGLGAYLADKNTGEFKDTFVTFSMRPTFQRVHGDIVQKYEQIVSTPGVMMNTNITAVFDGLLEIAVSRSVPEEDMPEFIVILSDMQFDRCAQAPNDSAYDVISKKFAQHGYAVPTVVFWNLYAHDNVPVKYDERGTVLISGFSPAIMKSVFSTLDGVTPEEVMLKTVMIDRYA